MEEGEVRHVMITVLSGAKFLCRLKLCMYSSHAVSYGARFIGTVEHGGAPLRSGGGGQGMCSGCLYPLSSSERGH